MRECVQALMSYTQKGIDPDAKISLPAGVAPVFPSDEKGMTAEMLKGPGGGEDPDVVLTSP